MSISKSWSSWMFVGAIAMAQMGCAVQRGQQTVGAYIDDAAIGCPLMLLPTHDRPVVDWARLTPMLCRKLGIAYSKRWKSA